MIYAVEGIMNDFDMSMKQLNQFFNDYYDELGNSECIFENPYNFSKENFSAAIE
jgi:hypothetical protein